MITDMRRRLYLFVAYYATPLDVYAAAAAVL